MWVEHTALSDIMVEIPIEEGMYPIKDGISYLNVFALFG